MSPTFVASRKARWMMGAVTRTGAELSRVTDPFAVPGVKLSSTAESFALAKRGATARGIWQVVDGVGAVRGHYRADFVPQRGVWRIRVLELLPAAYGPAAVSPYCMEPGDVEPCRARMEAMERERDQRRLERQHKKALRKDGNAAAPN